MTLLKALRFALNLQNARKKGLLLGFIIYRDGYADLVVLRRIGDLAVHRRGKSLMAWRIGSVFNLAGAQCVVAHETAASTLGPEAFLASAAAELDITAVESEVNEHIQKYWRMRACTRCNSLTTEEVCQTCGEKTVTTKPPSVRVSSLEEAIEALKFIDALEMPPLRLKLPPVTLQSDVLSKVASFTATEMAAWSITAFASLSDKMEGARRSMMLLGRVNWKVIVMLIIVMVIGFLIIMLLPYAAQSLAPGGGVRIP